MSIRTESQVEVVLADYLALDALGKLNVIGGNISILGSENGKTSPVGLAVIVQVPEAFVGKAFALSVELFDTTDAVIVQVPSPDGTLQALRAQQAVTVSPVMIPPGFAKPDNVLQCHVMTMNFGNGIPLKQGHTYEWRAQIDGQGNRDWFHRFHVLAPAPGVVLGGPANPATIPGVGTYIVHGASQTPPQGDDQTGDDVDDAPDN